MTALEILDSKIDRYSDIERAARSREVLDDLLEIRYALMVEDAHAEHLLEEIL